MSQCVAVQNPIYNPVMRLISAITNAKNAHVTTTFDHDYVTGTIVRFYINRANGMVQLNKKTAVITVTGSDTFTVPIDTTRFDTFSVPGGLSRHEFTCAQVVPIGEASDTLAAATRNTLPHS